MSTEGLPRGRLAALLGLTFLPVAVTTAVMTLLYGGDTPGALAPALDPRLLGFLVYAIVNWLTFGLVVALTGWMRLAELGLRFALTRRRLGAALLGFVAGVGIFVGTDWLLPWLGLPPVAGIDFPRPGALAALGLLFSVVVTASFCEEVFFRVLWMGALGRRVPLAVAGLASIAAFAAIHLPYFGWGGMVFIASWSTIPVVLFAQFRDFTPGLVMHALNNAFAYLVVPWVQG